MTTIKSDLSTKSFPNPAHSGRSYVIPDETPGAAPLRSPPGANVPSSTKGSLGEGEMISLSAINDFLRSNQGAPLRHQQAASLEVEDISTYEKQVQEARAAKVSGKERLSPAAVQRIKLLCNMTRVQKEVIINGQKFVLQTLKGKEQREVWMAAAEYENTVEFPFELRKQSLARSLIQIADTDVEFFLSSNDLGARLDMIEELPEEVLNELYLAFNELVSETKKQFSIKSEADAAEVVEELKK